MRLAAVLCAVVAGTAAQGQDQSAAQRLQKSLEMPGHRALMEVIAAPETELAPFETDGCSGGMSWSWRVVADLFPNFADAEGAQPPWEACCVTHDQAYHDAGGATEAEASFTARLSADEALRQCVIEQGDTDLSTLAARYEVTEDRIRQAYGLVAESMFNAVRFGGGPCSPLPWRWGYGYPGCVPGL